MAGLVSEPATFSGEAIVRFGRIVIVENIEGSKSGLARKALGVLILPNGITQISL